MYLVHQLIFVPGTELTHPVNWKIKENAVKMLNFSHYHQNGHLRNGQFCSYEMQWHDPNCEEMKPTWLGWERQNKQRNFGPWVIFVWKAFQRLDLDPWCTEECIVSSHEPEPSLSRWKKIKWTESTFWRCSYQRFLRPSRVMRSKLGTIIQRRGRGKIWPAVDMEFNYLQPICKFKTIAQKFKNFIKVS